MCALTHYHALATRHHVGPNTMHAAATTRLVCSAMAPQQHPRATHLLAQHATRHHHTRNSNSHIWLCQEHLSKHLHFTPIVMLTARPVWPSGNPCTLCKWSLLWETLLIGAWLQQHQCQSGPPWCDTSLQGQRSRRCSSRTTTWDTALHYHAHSWCKASSCWARFSTRSAWLCSNCANTHFNSHEPVKTHWPAGHTQHY